MNIYQSSTAFSMKRFFGCVLALLLMGLCQFTASASTSLKKHSGNISTGNVRIAPQKGKMQSRVAAANGDTGISGCLMCNAVDQDTYTNYGGTALNSYYSWYWGKPTSISYETDQTVLKYDTDSGYFYFSLNEGAMPLEAVKVYLAPNSTNNATISSAYADFETGGLYYNGTEIVTDYANGIIYWYPGSTYEFDNLFFYIESGELNVIGFEIYSQGNTPADFPSSGSTAEYVAAPIFRPTACSFSEPMTVEILSEGGTDIYFSTDGNSPTISEEHKYNGPIVISSTTTFKAIAVDADGNSSRVSTATYTCTRHFIGEGYDPDSPGNPGSSTGEMQGKTYKLTVVTNPSGAGSSYAGSYDLKAGAQTNVYTYNTTGFEFLNWTIEGEEVSKSTSFYYVMPEYDVTIVANYSYNPQSPGNPSPEEQKVKHPVVVRAIPSGAASLSPSGAFDMEENASRQIYAYPNTGWHLEGWTINGEQLQVATSPINVTMGEKALDIAAYFSYNPAPPSNPGANYYNPTTGQVVIDDFTPGSLYNALNNLVGYDNFSNISSIIVKGEVTSNDLGNLSYFTNAGTIDISRTGGVTTLPGYTFSSVGASSIILPSTVSSLGDYVFYNCANLSSLTIYAQEPPVCNSYTFSEFTNKANCTVYVPASAIELYSNAEYWKDFTILPITNDAHVLQVNLPADASDGRYKNYSLEIVNVNSGVRQKYVISDRLLYTFNGLQKDEQYNIYLFSQAGLEIGRIENVVIPDQDIEVTFDNLKSLHTVFAKVLGSDGSDVTSQVTVEWLKPLADGTTTYLRKAVSLGEMPDGQQLICRVTLDDKLGVVYANPEDIEFTVGADNNTCVVSLAPFRSIGLTGSVADGDGAALPGASVSVNQTLNGKYSKTYTAKTDSKGIWSLSVLDAPETRLTYAATECVNVNDTIGAFEANVNTLDLGKTTLKSIVGARVTYGFTYHAAGVEEVESYYSDYQNVAFSVFNVTQNRAHNEVSLQYPILAVLDENINVGDELKLTATSKTGAFNPIEKTVAVGENQRAEVTFDIVGKGGISATFEMTDNPAVTAMLYGSNEELLKKMTYSEAKALFTELEDGEYTLVTMGQSELMNSILRLSNFGEIGLTEGKDYVKSAVTVESGKLAEVNISEVPAFDESLFYYTNSSTSFSSNKSSITTGNYLTLRSAIDFKGVYKNDISNVALVVDLPETCDFVEQSVIQGPNLLPYTLDNNRLTVQLGNNYTSQTRFCVIPTAGGSFNATASIVFDYNGKTLTQPIGSSVAEVKDLEISVPKLTSRTTFHVTGVSFAKSDVKVYDNGTLLSVGKSNAVGSWDVECNLFEPKNLSEHNIYAEITTPAGVELVSETKTLIYDESCVEVNTVTMINTAHPATSTNLCDYVTVFDFQNPKKPDAYWYWPSYPRFTFLIDILYHDKKLIPFVWLHVFTSDGNVRSLRADYNESKDCWIAIDDFHSSALPIRVSVTIEDMRYDLADEATYNMLIDEYIGQITVGEEITDEDGTTTIPILDENSNPIAEIEGFESDKTPDEVIDDLKDQGYELDPELNDDSDYTPDDTDDDEGDVVALTKSDGSVAFVGGIMTAKPRVVIIKIIREEGKKSITEISRTITDSWRSFFRTYFDSGACEQVTEYKRYTEHLDKYVTITTSMKVAHTVYIDYKNLPPGITRIPAKQIIAKIRRIKHFTKTYVTYTMEYSRVPGDCKPKPPTPPQPPTPSCDYVMDPSGFVYEAIPANRVEGVQATIYYKETKEDMYGDPYEEVVLWNAEEYAQKNPLFTDENGMYQWDVPQGLWQVKFEKDGYQTAYSEWLPVPPPQLEVNIGIVQNKQPEVTESRAYEEGVEVQFDKFMDLSTLTTDNIYVTANGEKLTGEIRLIDSALADEYASEDDADATRYASRIRFVPEEKLSATTGEIRVTVSRNVLSYAGIPMTETFSQVLDVEKEVQTITADDVKVLYGGEKEVTIYALPYEAAVGRILRIANSSDLITSVDVTEATLDEEGKAVVKVKGDLPGRAQLTFTIDDVTATGECAVDVVTEIVTAEAPKSSRASGTAVYRGTKVELTTESKDGVIYFTTDGSCPCDENGTRRKYTVPIIINEDTKILAMTSVGNGDDDVSETVEFNYTIKHSDMDFQMAEGWTWISHNFESAIAPADLSADEGISRILSQTQEVIRDPQMGMVGTLTELSASESYKVETTAATARQRLSDIAWNPATPIALKSGWNWLGYPVGQTMSVDEAFADADAETLDVVVGQSGFAQFDGEKWVGTLETMSPGMGYMYQSQSAKNVVYNTSIVSTASAKYASGINGNSPLVLDIHKYGVIMPVVATINNTDGSQLDNEDYQVAAFCGTECRGIGRVVNGLVMMNVYGNVNDNISFQVTDADGEISFDNNASLKFSETVVGDIFNPYAITINNMSGIDDVKYDGNIKVTVEADMLRIKGIAAGDVDLVEIYDLDGQKLIRETNVSESGIRISTLTSGVYVVIVNGNGEYSYHKIAVR